MTNSLLTTYTYANICKPIIHVFIYCKISKGFHIFSHSNLKFKSESSDASGLYDEILLGTSVSGENKIIRIETDQDQTTLYQKIKSTFAIKQIPPDESG